MTKKKLVTKKVTRKVSKVKKPKKLKVVKSKSKKAADYRPQARPKFVKAKFIDGARIIASTVEAGRTVRFMATNGCRYKLPRAEYDSLPKKASKKF